jgi:hypothetical protein
MMGWVSHVLESFINQGGLPTGIADKVLASKNNGLWHGFFMFLLNFYEYR